MKIHHWFIPNKHNKFHPIALRSSGLVVFMALLLMVPMLYNIITAHKLQILGYATDINITDIYNLTNEERQQAGLGNLKLNDQLNRAANAKAHDMFQDDYWSHIAPDGTTPWSFINNTGYNYTVAGENLAKNFDTSAGVVNGWMNSESHRDNILKSDYQDIGLAIVNGVLQGEETTLVVAMYGAQNLAVATNATSNETVSSTPETTEVSDQKVDPVGIGETDIGTQMEQPIQNQDEGPQVAGITDTISRAYGSMNWGQKISILLICIMILLFVMKHTIIWRQQKRGYRHIWLRSHPLGQAIILVVGLIITIVSGVGVVL